MSSNSEQNGRQPPLSQQTAPPSDPRLRNASSTDQQRICRDYVWGICGKGTQCKFRHEFDVESMKNILKFCHDYQNRTGCTRPDCTYLHTTREEENLFLTTGQIPRALAERHAAMFSAPMNVYVNEYMGQAPPPPPPPPPQAAATPVAATPCATAAVPPTHPYAAAQPPPPPAPLRPLLAPPPPPPPPPPPTSSSVPALMTPPVFTAPAPFSSPAMYAVTQPPPPLPMFDASRPPPPLSTVTLKTKKSVVVKRPAESSEAGPSKARKLESSKVVERLCESCVQRELRIDLYRKEMQRLECEREYHTYIYETKSEGYENGRLLLKSVLSPESFRILDEYIEGSSTHFNQMSAFSATSTVPRQFLLQLMDCVFNNSRSLLDSPPVPSVGMDEFSLLQSLTTLTRRSEPINDAPTDVIQAVLGVLRNSTSLSSFRSTSTETRASESLADGRGASNSTALSSGAAVNGLSHFLNGQKTERVGAVPASRAFPTTQAVPPAAPLPAPAAPLPAAPAPPPPRPAAQPATRPAAPAPAGPASYLPYQPPPARPYYPQYPAGFNHLPNAAYSSPARAAAAPLAPQRAPAPAQPPAPPQQNYNVYGAARYPSQPHYYPPFQ
ncbi:unnamed protein product [Chrysodeixis includens]|uniref:C3H1-type domain-containing protein n=1 Tax=Chrysodeixis includens TaxID=689277 RepID=A0A9P0BK07_CHRIL|nr:unnamed protein product [Chrysodeixis includens]